MAIQAQFPLCDSQDWMDSSGCGGFNQSYFNVQQQKQLIQQQQQQCNVQQQIQNQQMPRNQSVCFDNVNSSPLKNNCNMSSYLPMAMASHEEKQRQEIDHYIRLQNGKLRLLLQEQRSQHLGLLLKSIELKVLPLLGQKDREIAQATKRTMELENILKTLEQENQAWQRVAQENEAMVMSLNNTIEELKENAFCCFNNGAGDAESCCDVQREVETENEEEVNRGFIDDNIKEEEKARKMMMTTMSCKVCNSRKSCILFLPCRHLCSCEACEAFLDSCPLCQTAKKATIEALMI